jgi:diguanylate cyclase (GGDEF)-like protein/PAS domain S-box-containing protein
MYLTGRGHDLFFALWAALVASGAAYMSFSLVARSREAFGRTRGLLVLQAAAVLGIGVWSMYFTVVQSDPLPDHRTYSLPLVIAALLVGVAGAGLALFHAERVPAGRWQLLQAGLLTGLMAVAINWIGMHGIHMAFWLYHDPFWFLIAVLMALAVGVGSLQIGLTAQSGLLRAAAALLLGGGLVGAHMAVMVNAHLVPTTPLPGDPLTRIGGEPLVASITVVTVLALIGVALVTLLIERRSAQNLLRILQTMGDAFVVLDRNWRVQFMNSLAEQALERTLDTAKGRSVWEEFPEAIGSSFQDRIERVMASREPAEFETCYRGRWYEFRVFPSASGISLYFRDITERKQAEREQEATSRRLAFLAEASALLSSTLEQPERALQFVAPLAVRHLADWCVVHIADSIDTLRIISVAHADPAKQPVAEAVALRHLPQSRRGGHLAQVMSTGQPHVVREIVREEMLASAEDEEHRRLLVEIGPRSFLTVPILLHGQTVGTISLFSGREDRLYDPDDLEMAEELARRAAVALEHSSLYEEAQEALQQARLHAEALREQERLYRLVTDNSRDLVALHDRDGRLLYVSPSCAAILGYEQQELLGRQLEEFVQTDYIAAVQSLHGETQTDPAVYRIRKKGGEYAWFETVSQPIFDEQDQLVQFQSSSRDISERKTIEEQLARQAFSDSLTGLANRIAYMERLKHALIRSVRRKERTAVLFLDLDNFKVINDSLGHEAGDQLLQHVARRIQSCLRAEDTAARLGGDEFALLLESIYTEEDAIRVVDRVSTALAPAFVLDGHEVFVTFSIGITLSEIGSDPKELLREADVAMYYAKNRGKARYAFYEPNMNFRLVERLDLASDLRRAVERQELCLFYQPMVDLATGRITGVEALLRWEHPDRGMILPEEFIPVAEETGLIVPIGHWVIEEACRQASRWQQLTSGRPLKISVNLSARQLLERDLPEFIASTLAATAVRASDLQLEITESILVHDVEATSEVLRALKEMDVGLAIDDFGTGYSALSYFKRYPFDTLKIDRAFVNGLGEDRQDSAIVSTVIMLAKTLNLKVVGEGIETAQQLDQLRSLGCDSGQGYHFARPVSADAMVSLLQEG